jgi:large subunit ribosomal protein L29
MSALKMAEVIGKDKAALIAQISELKRELLNLRFQKVAGELNNTARFREVRVSIARANTELSKLNRQAKR